MDMRRFLGKNVLLTGAATGIGRATAVRLAAEGANVCALDVKAEDLAETERAAADAGPGRVLARVADVSDEAAVAGAVAAARDEFGGLDVLVNVAGVHRVVPLPELTVDDFRRLFDVNLIGTFLCCREAMPALVESGGVVVNVASVSATRAHPWMSAYAASKGAVLAFTISLAAEYAERGVRAVAISPGGVATPITRDVAWPDGADPMYYARVVPLVGEWYKGLVRFGAPEQIAGTIAYAASADAGFLTGVEIRVDGGSHM